MIQHLLQKENISIHSYIKYWATLLTYFQFPTTSTTTYMGDFQHNAFTFTQV